MSDNAATSGEDKLVKKEPVKMGLYPWAVLAITVLVRVMV
jgi:hypothetical protein